MAFSSRFPRLAIGVALAMFVAASPRSRGADPWLVLKGADGPGKGKHVVLVSGDEEYRSEEALPQLAKILAKHHGFKCTVLFAIDQGRRDQPHPQRQHPRPGSAQDGRPDGDPHPVSRPARRPDEADRRLRRVGPADRRPAHGDARLQPQARQEPTPTTPGPARNGTAASAGRCWARRGSTTTASTASRARAASSRQAAENIRFCGASRTATSGARPTSTACACRCRATASRWCWARCSKGMKPDRQAGRAARRTSR